MAVNWTSKQQEVIDSRNRNLLVSAAAGSGKTAASVERIIQIISEGGRPLDIDQLLVMTFTNTTAAEMRERTSTAVEQKLKKRPENEYLWLQATPIPQAQITTTDSSCLNIIRSHYSSLDIDPALRTGDEGELSLLRRDRTGEMLENCYDGADEEFGRFVEHFGRGRSNRGIEDAILQAWQSSQSHPRPQEWLAACQKELEEESIGEMEESPWMVFLMEDMARQVVELSGQLGEALNVCLEENGPLAYEPVLISDRSKIEAIGRAVSTGSFEALYNSLQNMSLNRLASIWSKDIDGDKKAFVSTRRDRIKKAVAKCRELYGQQNPQEVMKSMRGTRRVIRELLRLTGMFDQAYRDAKRERNVLDFNDLEHLALEVLYVREGTGSGEERISRHPSQMADKLSRQYKEILVDEYQNGNYVQEALITSISRGRFGYPNIFMAGDVKQNIYRLRLARLELFMDKYEKYSRQGGPYQMIELQQNFRNRESVLTSVNDVFCRIMTKNLGEITYTPETALYPGTVFGEANRKTVCGPGLKEGEPDTQESGPVSLLAGTPTELLTVDTGAEALKQLDEGSLDHMTKELEARLIVGRIRQLVNQGQGILVWDKSRGAYRRARYGDVVILLRSMTGWSEVFVDVLMSEGIPAFAQTRTGYFSMVEVETVPNLLSVVDNPMQDIPLAAAMRSPTVGMDDEEMAWVMVAYKRSSQKGQNQGVYGAWRLWLEEGPVPEEELEQEEGLRPGEGPGSEEESEQGEDLGSGKGPGPEESPDREEGLITVGLCSIPTEAAHSIPLKSLKLPLLMKRLWGEARHLSIHELLYRVYRESGHYDYVSAMPAGETRWTNLDMLVEKAAAYESTSYKGLFHLVRYIEKLKKFDTDFSKASVAGEQDNTAHIMSVHKSKDLEFPVVSLAGLGKRFNKQDTYGQTPLDADLGAAADPLDLELRVKAPTLKKRTLKRRLELEIMGERFRALYVAMTKAKEKLIMTVVDKSLGNELGKWKDIPLSQGQLPYTILVLANSCLDWLLMAQPAIPATHMEMRQIQVKGLIGEEVTRQTIRKMKKEDLLNLDGERVYDAALRTHPGKVPEYEYPYELDTELYAMVSVSELRKRSQIGRTEDAIGTDRDNLGGATLGGLTALRGKQDVAGSRLRESGERNKPSSSGPNRGALRGTAYHAVLEHIRFYETHNLSEVKPVVDELLENGFLDQEVRDFINSNVIWNFLSSSLGTRMVKAQVEGRIHKEQQFIIGILAGKMGLGDSDELVLIQGIADACLEEEDGLALIDYKTDHVPGGSPKQGEKMLTERYRVQLDYYECALTQLTEKHVKERIIYSPALQMSTNVRKKE